MKGYSFTVNVFNEAMQEDNRRLWEILVDDPDRDTYFTSVTPDGIGVYVEADTIFDALALLETVMEQVEAWELKLITFYH